MSRRLLAIACFGIPILLTLPASAENVLFTPEEYVACGSFMDALQTDEAGTRRHLDACVAEAGTEELCERRLVLRLERCGEVLGEKDTFQQMGTDAGLAQKHARSRLRKLASGYKQALASTQAREASGDTDATAQSLLEIYDVYWLVSWTSLEAAEKMNQRLRTDASEVGLELASVDAYVIEALDALRAAKLRGDFETIESAIQTQREK